MSIELHCSKCNKLIRAPDNVGGKRGKCPYCGESVYVPMPHDDDEEIRVAPVDADEQRREKELQRESNEYIAAIGHGTAVPEDAGTPASDGPAGGTSQSGEDLDLDTEVEAFIVAMRDSKLDKAEQTVKRLKAGKSDAHDYVKSLIRDEMFPQIKGVPPPLVKGFLNKLLDGLG